MTDEEKPDPDLSLGRPRRAAEAPPLPPGQDRGAHHASGGRFRNPWAAHPELEQRPGGLLAWLWERIRSDLPDNPEPDDVPRGTPAVAMPRAAPDEIRMTLVGHATVLIQVGGLNLLTDPIWSSRAGPFSLVGGPRFAEPGLPMEALPPLDAVLLSHGHYDHLDAATTKRLVARYGPDLPWLCPLGHGSWLRGRGVSRVVELDWWEEVPASAASGGLRLICLPVRHWTRRGLHVNRELWCSWAVVRESGEPGVYFGGDSGYCPAFLEIGHRLGPFAASILPIGAYEPRWFMADSHMNPEEAVRAYENLGGAGAFVGMHWGTFRLTDEDPLEPPERARAAWQAAGLPAEGLHLPGAGGTVVVGRR